VYDCIIYIFYYILTEIQVSLVLVRFLKGIEITAFA